MAPSSLQYRQHEQDADATLQQFQTQHIMPPPLIQQQEYMQPHDLMQSPQTPNMQRQQQHMQQAMHQQQIMMPQYMPSPLQQQQPQSGSAGYSVQEDHGVQHNSPP